MMVGPRGIQMSSLDELWRFAQYISKSGFAPKGMEAPESIVVAMELGLELGVTPMTAIQNIAVINGRPAIWGDLVLAIVRGSGQLEVFEEWLEQDGRRCDRSPTTINASTSAFCRVKRNGYAPHTSCFSMMDAERAGLKGKQGPWSQYPTRMLQMRARAFALRDQFGDALKGLLTHEEAQDLDPVSRARNVTPKQPNPKADQAPADGGSDDAQEADDIPMDFPPTEPAKAVEAVVESGHKPKWEVLQESVLAHGIKFSQFVSGLKESGLMDDAAEPDSYETLPTAIVSKLAKSPNLLSTLVNAIKAGGAR